jgi:hypothetical protein
MKLNGNPFLSEPRRLELESDRLKRREDLWIRILIGCAAAAAVCVVMLAIQSMQ